MKSARLYATAMGIAVMHFAVCAGGNVESDTAMVVPVKKPPQMSIYFSSFSGGPHDVIRNAILKAGFGDDIPDQWAYLFGIPVLSFPGQSYPIDETRTRQFGVAIQDNVYKMHGWFADLTGMSETTIKGLHITDQVNYNGVSISANSDAAFLSLGYMVSTSDGVGILKIGPSLAFSHTDINCSQDLNIDKILPGIHVNGEIHIIKNSVGFIGLQMGYRNYMKIQTEATVLHTLQDETALILPEMTIDFNHIYFGLHAGLNLGPQ